jgi:nitrite reductase (NADH) small subunit
VDDIPHGEGRAVTVGGRRIAVFRAEDGWFALDAACPHLGGPLADGIVSRNTVICPLHERRFDLASGEALNGEECVATHPVEIRGGHVYVEAPAAVAAPAVPSQARNRGDTEGQSAVRMLARRARLSPSPDPERKLGGT